MALGAFNTEMAAAAQIGSVPLPEDYKGSVTDKTIEIIKEGTMLNWPNLGDKDKAAKVIFDVVVGRGVGAGREAEVLLPLGVDLAKRVFESRGKLDHAMEVFGEICNGVAVDN